MDLSNQIAKNYRSLVNLITGEIDTVMQNPDRKEQIKQTIGGKIQYGFSFPRQDGIKFVMPMLREQYIKKGYSDVKWDVSEKFNVLYVYLYE